MSQRPLYKRTRARCIYITTHTETKTPRSFKQKKHQDQTRSRNNGSTSKNVICSFTNLTPTPPNMQSVISRRRKMETPPPQRRNLSDAHAASPQRPCRNVRPNQLRSIKHLSPQW